MARQVANAPEMAQSQPLQRAGMEEEEIQMKPLAHSITPLVQRQEEEEELQMKPLVQRQAEEEELQMKPAYGPDGGPVQADVEQAIQQARGEGRPLADEVRGPMEQSFGVDFGGVRIHTDGQSEALNRSLNAQAFTTGQDIFFRQGAYAPGNSGGRQLLAHELTHVVQQTGTRRG